MIVKQRWFWSLLISCAVMFSSQGLTYAQLGDVTNLLQYVGNPTQAKFLDGNVPCRFARNPWTMIGFGSKVYIGSGNANNNGPCINSGTFYNGTDLWSLTPSTGVFAVEYGSAPDEEFQRMRLVGGQLYVIGADPVDAGGGSLGNFYRQESGVWVQKHTLPNTFHFFDMAKDSLLNLIAVGQFTSPGGIRVSSNDGMSWVSALCDGVPCVDYPQFYRLFWHGNTLYAQGEFAGPIIYKSNGGTAWTSISEAITHIMLPVVNGVQTTRIAGWLPWSSGFAYLVGTNADDEWHLKPSAVMYSTSMGVSTRLVLPRPNAVPRDMRVIGGRLYVLQSIYNYDGTPKKQALDYTTDGVNWYEAMYWVNQPTVGGIARSMEYVFVNGVPYWYFGIGTDATLLAITSGSIVRIAAP